MRIPNNSSHPLPVLRPTEESKLPMTFDAFCRQWDVTLRERKELLLFLATLRFRSTLRLAYPGI